MLSQQELDTLLNILTEPQKPFEEIATTFYRSFAKPEQFKAGCVICMLIQDNLLTQTQRLVGFYLLYDIYRMETEATTPFVPLVLEMVEQTHDMAERKFLLQFLSALPKELPKQSVQGFLQSCDPQEQPMVPDLDALRLMHQEGAPVVSSSGALGLRPVLNDKSDEGYWVGPPPNEGGDSSAASSLELRPEELTLLGYGPAWARPEPPLLEPTVDETFWLLPPQMLSEPLWEYTMCANTSLGAEVRELFAKAVQTPLPPDQAQVIIDGLGKDVKLVYHCGLTPKMLPQLVEHNPQIAIKVLLKLMRSPFPSQISRYFMALEKMEMSCDNLCQSLEVVNGLTTSADLPPEFIHLYISKCISSCESIKEEDMRNRPVRLVCEFLQSLIRTKTIVKEDPKAANAFAFVSKNQVRKPRKVLRKEGDASKKVAVKAKRPRCRRCDKRGHTQADCPDAADA